MQLHFALSLSGKTKSLFLKSKVSPSLKKENGLGVSLILKTDGLSLQNKIWRAAKKKRKRKTEEERKKGDFAVT